MWAAFREINRRLTSLKALRDHVEREEELATPQHSGLSGKCGGWDAIRGLTTGILLRMFTFEFPKVSAVLPAPRPVSDPLKALQVLIVFPKFLVSFANSIEVPRPVSVAQKFWGFLPSSHVLWLHC